MRGLFLFLSYIVVADAVSAIKHYPSASLEHDAHIQSFVHDDGKSLSRSTVARAGALIYRHSHIRSPLARKDIGGTSGSY